MDKKDLLVCLDSQNKFAFLNFFKSFQTSVLLLMQGTHNGYTPLKRRIAGRCGAF
jgi:hypothetical protein